MRHLLLNPVAPNLHLIPPGVVGLDVGHQRSPDHHRHEGPPPRQTESLPLHRPTSSASSHLREVARCITHSVPVLRPPEHVVARAAATGRATTEAVHR
jgi:hypothetical protein